MLKLETTKYLTTVDWANNSYNEIVTSYENEQTIMWKNLTNIMLRRRSLVQKNIIYCISPFI